MEGCQLGDRPAIPRDDQALAPLDAVDHLAAVIPQLADRHLSHVSHRITRDTRIRAPLAGFRHYEAAALWNEIKPGDPLDLVREPGNPRDRNAIRVEWRGSMLGYVPRAQNETVARQLDHGTAVKARVSKVQHSRAPNQRIEFEVYVPMDGWD